MLCNNILTNIVQEGVKVPASDKPILKMLVCHAPSYPPKTGPTPKKLMPLRESFYFSLILFTTRSLKSLKAAF